MAAYRKGRERIAPQSGALPSQDSRSGAKARLASSISDDVLKLASFRVDEPEVESFLAAARSLVPYSRRLVHDGDAIACGC
jgi:hypothetical protein